MRYLDILKTFPVAAFIADEFFNLIYFNDMMLEISGVSKNNVNKRGLDAFEFCDEKGDYINLKTCSCLCDDTGIVMQRNVFLRTDRNGLKPVFISAKNEINSHNEKMKIFAVTDLTKMEGCGVLSAGDLKYKPFHNIAGSSKEMYKLYGYIKLASESDVNVMILGESGTGKELIASAIHYESNRMNKPFLRINCSALAENLLESELFGHVKGSFTSAVSDRIGKFEAAEGGTLFLDEIGDISPIVQVKLLRAVQERIITRVGENIDRKIDIRIIAATNKNLKKLVDDGVFREDLYYRLNVFPILTIPLRERVLDIPETVDFLIDKINNLRNASILGMTKEALDAVMKYSWPGNVRELENTIEYASVFKKSGYIEISDIPLNIKNQEKRELKSDGKPDYRRAYISKEELISILDKFSGSRKDTAEYLGISSVALWKKMKKFNLI